MKIGYGLITCQHHPEDPHSGTDLYRQAVQRCVLAEAVGFDSAWVSEHHFVDDGYMPSLLVTCAAIAQATDRVEIGTGIVLGPLHHPLRLAEDAATVDLISRGRLILGLGAGWREEEFEVFDVPLDERGRRMRELVDILRLAWSADAFSYAGRTWTFDNVNVTPKPARPIPIWLGAFAPPAIRRAGRIADGFLGSSTGTSGIQAFADAREAALEARADSPRAGEPFSFALHVPVYCSDAADPWSEVAESYNYLRWKYPDMAMARGATTNASPPPIADADELRSSIICGSPNEVVDQIAAFRDGLGDDIHFICRSDLPGLDTKLQTELIERIGSQVIPALR